MQKAKATQATTTQATEKPGSIKLLLSPRSAAEALECSVSRLYELMLNGSIASIKQGRNRRIPVAALEAYVARQLAEQGVVIGDGGQAA